MSLKLRQSKKTLEFENKEQMVEMKNSKHLNSSKYMTQIWTLWIKKKTILSGIHFVLVFIYSCLPKASDFDQQFAILACCFLFFFGEVFLKKKRTKWGTFFKQGQVKESHISVKNRLYNRCCMVEMYANIPDGIKLSYTGSYLLEGQSPVPCFNLVWYFENIVPLKVIKTKIGNEMKIHSFSFGQMKQVFPSHIYSQFTFTTFRNRVSKVP